MKKHNLKAKMCNNNNLKTQKNLQKVTQIITKITIKQWKNHNRMKNEIKPTRMKKNSK